MLHCLTDLFDRWSFVLLVVFVQAACARPDNFTEQSTPEVITTASGLIYEVVEAGTGPVAKPGEMALIHEITKLADGTVITDTWAMNFPIRFLLGGGQVIDGLDEAVTGMRVGERRRLIVPPSLSKRTSYPDNLSPDDTLYYDVMLLQVSEP